MLRKSFLYRFYCPSYIFILIFISTPFNTFSQAPVLKFKQISEEQGLSNSFISSTCQDSRGFMWFGTANGLNRYDGDSIKVYRRTFTDPSSLSNNIIRNIYNDPEHHLWIGTENGLNLFNPYKDNFVIYRHIPGNNRSISANNITNVYEDRKSNLWVGTVGGGLNLLNRHTNTFDHFRHRNGDKNSISSDTVNCVFEDTAHHLWVATNTGLNLFNRANKTFTLITNPYGDAGNIIHYIQQDREGNLWLGTYYDGVVVYNLKQNTFKHYTHNLKDPGSLSTDIIGFFTGGLLIDREGRVWIGGLDQGLNLYDPKHDSFFQYRHESDDPETLSQKTACGMCEDNQGNLWVGTRRGGVSLYTPGANKFTSYHKEKFNSISNNDVRAFCEDKNGDIWVGTDGGGLNLFNRKNNTFSLYKNDPFNLKSLSNDAVTDIMQDKDENIWVSTWGGLNLFDRKSGTFKRFTHKAEDSTSISSNWVVKTHQDSFGNFWVATWDGLNLFNPKTGKFKAVFKDNSGKTSVSGSNFWAMNEDKAGNMWFGAVDGALNCYNLKTDRFTQYFNYYSQDLGAIFTDSKGRVWIGKIGLYLFDPVKKKFSMYTHKGGLDKELIKSIAEDGEGNLWTSSSVGLTKFNPDSYFFRKFKLNDGIQGKEFEYNASLMATDGEMFFGGVNGFNTFYPAQIKTNPFIPPVYITDLQVFNKSIVPGQPASPLTGDISLTKEIRLSYDQSYISFRFAALNYLQTENNRYAYKLEGFDKDWVLAGNTKKAVYNNLSPGTYIFHVRASNNDGVWNNQGAMIKIIIAPPFWATWWFRYLGSISIVIIFYAFYRYTLRRIKRQKEILEQQVKQRTAEVLQKVEELQGQSAHLQVLNRELKINKEQERAAREEAEKANQAKSVFLATMSHEIRTPMNGIIGMASLLRETHQTNEQKDYTDTIITSGENLVSVINDILDFSKIESGKMDIEQADFDLRQSIEEVMDLFSLQAEKQKIELIYQVDFDVPYKIKGDSLRLKQVLINLINNALKFTKLGEVFLKTGIFTQPGNDSAIEIIFTIKDTGIGIPAEKLSSLFQAFSQVDSSTTRKYGGSGLGLVISERLVKLMGGKIWAESLFGEGTSFNFTIKTHALTVADRQVDADDLTGLAGKTVLIADDNQTSLDVIKLQLEHWGLKVLCASTAGHALELFSKEHKPDLVITDMRMDDMNGVALAQAIKARADDMPVILLGSKSDEIKMNYPDLFSLILTKPVKYPLLFKHMRAIFKNEAQAPEQKDAKVLDVEFSKIFPFKILIAEDNLINQKLIQRVLNKLGFEIEMAANGLDALRMMEVQGYNLILMDVQMPEMDGIEATQKIRRRTYKQPYIIALTANAMPEDREKCIAAGMDDYLAKPMKIEELTAALTRAAIYLGEEAGKA